MLLYTCKKDNLQNKIEKEKKYDRRNKNDS